MGEMILMHPLNLLSRAYFILLQCYILSITHPYLLCLNKIQKDKKNQNKKNKKNKKNKSLIILKSKKKKKKQMIVVVKMTTMCIRCQYYRLNLIQIFKMIHCPKINNFLMKKEN